MMAWEYSETSEHNWVIIATEFSSLYSYLTLFKNVSRWRKRWSWCWKRWKRVSWMTRCQGIIIYDCLCWGKVKCFSTGWIVLSLITLASNIGHVSVIVSLSLALEKLLPQHMTSMDLNEEYISTTCFAFILVMRVVFVLVSNKYCSY